MRDIPIIFSGPMVRALLEGRKTMTRRLAEIDRVVKETADNPEYVGTFPTPWPKLAVGDRLWVRENFSGPHVWEKIPPSGWGWDTMERPPLWYWADGNPKKGDWTKTRPCIHMPRWASRITLIVESTNVEALQDISEEDAAREGIGVPYLGDGDPPFEECATMVSRKMQFRNLWNSLHGAACPWGRNPPVVAIGFKVITSNIDQV